MTIQLESTHKEDIMSRRTSLTLLRSVFPGVEVFYTREGHTQPQDKCIKANPDAKLFMAYQNSQKDECIWHSHKLRTSLSHICKRWRLSLRRGSLRLLRADVICSLIWIWKIPR